MIQIDVQMPSNCYDCWIRKNLDCRIANYNGWLNNKRADDCPLKAQEPVEPVLDIDTWKCGNCGHALEHQQLLGDNVLLHEQYNYCPECGRKVKWDGTDRKALVRG